VVEDRKLKDKTPESFAHVFQTKVRPALVLARTLRPESLKFLAFFSSVSGRVGNAGQADYSAANECLNKLAAHLDREWPCRVVAMNWGPWDCGLISDALRAAYTERGIRLIPPGAGSRACIDELRLRDTRAPEVVLACDARRIVDGGERPPDA
jgi:NAD(P)-dependent dehydrogenase (short-subunit alcohol dehydrogenase family)